MEIDRRTVERIKEQIIKELKHDMLDNLAWQFFNQQKQVQNHDARLSAIEAQHKDSNAEKNN
jgi:hypothetical protein